MTSRVLFLTFTFV